MSMVEHDDGFSHSAALQCGKCPGYPHVGCLDRAAVAAAVAVERERVLAEVEALLTEWEGTVYKLPPGHPLTVNGLCVYHFKVPLRDLVERLRTDPSL